jgi:SAM-dependent methyltransferase
MISPDDVRIETVRDFWQKNPVAAAGIAAELGTAGYFEAFDALREHDDCEPYVLSDRIHGYSSAQGLKVLDIGCGNGYVLFQYARNGADVTGVDLTATAIDLSRKRFAQGGLMVDEIYRVLKPGGRLIVMLYHRYSWKNIVLLRLRRLFDPKFRGKSHQQVLNMNDGDECPLALVYSRVEAARLFHRFVGIEFMLTFLSWKQLFMLPPLVRLAQLYLPPSSHSLPARWMGWNLNIHAIKPASQKA